MDVAAALLDSWDRQSRIVLAVACLVDDTTRSARPSDDGMPLDHQLAHIHQVRRFFLGQLDAERAGALPAVSSSEWGAPIEDLDAIRDALTKSGVAVREAVKSAIAADVQKAGWYDNAVLYLQHMLWHEGWHVGLIFLALRLAGKEPPQEWEEANVWGEWRTEEW